MDENTPIRRVAILVEPFNRYGTDVFSGISQYIYEHPHWETCHLDFVMETSPPPWLAHWHGDGIILRNRSSSGYETAIATGAKVVNLSVIRDPNHPCVRVDQQDVIRQAIDHLQERFLEHFGFVNIQGVPFSEIYCRHFEEITQKNGSVFHFQVAEQYSDHPEKENVRLEKWIRNLPKPVGIIGCHDPIGVKVLEICAKCHIPVPSKVAVLGINDDVVHSKLARPPMSSVILNGHQVGYRSCELLEKMMNGEPYVPQPLVPAAGIATRRSTDTLAINDKLLVRAITFIRKNATFGINVASVASEIGMNRRTLERRFEQAGIGSPLLEINRVKLHEVCDLLQHTDWTVETIASKTGFRSTVSLFRAFRSRFGTTPSEYRHKNARSLDKEAGSDS